LTANLLVIADAVVVGIGARLLGRAVGNGIVFTTSFRVAGISGAGVAVVAGERWAILAASQNARFTSIADIVIIAVFVDYATIALVVMIGVRTAGAGAEIANTPFAATIFSIALFTIIDNPITAK